MLKSLNKTTQFMSASMMTGVAMFVSSEAFAQGDFKTYTKTISESTAPWFTNTIAFLCYMGGFVLGALGVVGLKQHVENPGNAPMKNGLAKLGFGGMLMALPPIVSAIQGTADDATGKQTNINQFTAQGIQ